MAGLASLPLSGGCDDATKLARCASHYVGGLKKGSLKVNLGWSGETPFPNYFKELERCQTY